MAKKKVHELAKELNMQSKDICQALSEKGVDVKPQSAISDEDAQYIISKFGQPKAADNEQANETAKDIKKEDKKASKPAKDDSAKAGAEEKKAEEVKPKRIITSRGMVRPKGADGERRRRPDGEKRPRPDGERRPRPDGEKHHKLDKVEPKKKQELTPEEMKAKFDQILNKNSGTTANKEVKEETKPVVEEKKESVEIPQQIGLKIVAPPEPVKKKVETATVEKKPVTEAEKSETTTQATANAEKPAKEVTAADNDQARDNRGQKNDRDNRKSNDRGNGDRPRNNDRFQNNGGKPRNNDRYQNNGDRPRNNDRFQNNGDRPRNNDRYQNNGDRPRNNDRFQNNGDRPKNDRFQNNGDRPRNDRFQSNGERMQKDGDRQGQNGFNGDRRNDRRRQDSAPATEVIQDKDRKSRENKLRQDKQDRNKKNFEDGQRNGRNGRGTQLQHKSMLQKPQKKKEEKKEEIKIISIPEVITIGELAEKMKMQASAIIKKLFLEGKMVTVNSEVDFESAEEIAMGFDIMCEQEEKVDVIEELLKEEAEDEETMIKRPPVVCVMGHVDHGKTSLLDAIKETNVISQEAGGITQHIGAYMVDVNGEKITFLDTPGHEAFTAMRMRGAQSTDIAILVVAADDGVMPQTIEAINHAKAAEIEIIVAINKIDKPGANIDRVKQELAEYELLAEDWGGSTIMVPVSAHTREGIDTLLEMVILQSEVLELKANPDRLARGLIIEAKLDKGKGSVATVLVQKGTLHVGDHVAAGSNYGRVRAMVDDKGRQVKEATPSTPVSILGLNGVPNAGEVLVSTESGNEARSFAETFITESRAKLLEGTKYRLSLDDLNSQIEAGNLKELNLIIKADVQGSVEAIKQSMVKLSNEEVEVKVIHGGVGAINESDVILASASNAIIIGFNVKPDNQAQEVAQKEQVDIRLYSVIYSAIEDVEMAMKGMLDPVFEEKIIGHAEIRQIFKASGVGNIAGSYVLDGVFERGCSVRITRDGEQIFDGPLASLKRFKDDVKEVKSGFECGLVFEKFNDIAEFDQVEAYKMVEVPR